MTTPAIKRIFDDGLRAAIPDGGLSISKWAETYRYVERTARPGRWSNDTVPFLTEIMDTVTQPDVREVIFMKSAQVGGSELAVNIIGYYIHIDPTYIIYIGEQEDKSKAWTQESFDSTVRNTPVLKALVSDDPSDNNQRIKRFPGGQLTIAWASSPAQLSSRPAKVLIFDERDAYIPTQEGDAVKLAEARTKTFSGEEKKISISTPRDKETSTIEPAYMEGDRREYYVPCPQCGEMQTLKWANVRWDEEPLDAFYVCDANGCLIEHEEKPEMLAKGKWIASDKFRGTASFRINELYSPFTTWGSMADDFVKSKKTREKLRVFVNTRLGETWEEQGEQIEYADLKFHQEDYTASVPHGVLVLTAGVDVQGDRLECEVVGWGKDLESWSIDYKIIEGIPAQADVWDDLSDYLTQIFDGEAGPFRIAAACIDSGGHHTQQVYRFCKANAGRRWFAIKGANVPGRPLVSKPTTGNMQKVRLFTVGTDTAKDEIFAFLKVAEPGPGFCHFPAGDIYDERYFKQLCAEKKITKYVQGIAKQVWVKVSEGARNEALDVRVYATAARAILNPNLEKIAKRRLVFPEAADRPSEPVDEDVENSVEKPVNNNKKKRFVVKNNPFS
jgi:phage terminase large subunit GpA-like protein